MTTNYSNLIANIFTAVNVLPQCNRPGTEDVEFWAQMTALSLNPNGCAPVDVFIAIAETLGYDWDFDSIELAMNKADAWGGTGDDFGRLEVFTIDRPNGIFGLHGKVYVEIYYDDPECDMPERYADEVDDDWAEFVHEAYLQDEQTAREAEAQASVSELESAGFAVEEVEPASDEDCSFEKRVRLDANKFYQVQIRILPVADWEPDDGWRTVFITSIYQHAIERLSKEPGRDVDSDDLPF